MAVKTVKVAAKDSFTMDVKTYAITRNPLESIYHSMPTPGPQIENRRDSFFSFRVNSISDVFPAGVIFKTAKLCFYVSSLIESEAKSSTLECASHFIKIEESSISDLLGQRYKITESDKLYTLGWHYCPLRESDLFGVLVNGISLCFFWQGAWADPNTANIESARTANAPYIEITYDDLKDIPPTVQALSPVNDIVDGNSACTFSWSYAQRVNVPQSHYTIECDIGNGWATKVEKCVGSGQQHIFPAGSLSSGNIRWRVKVYSAYADGGAAAGTVASEWSAPAPIVVRKTPDAPALTNPQAIPRLTVTWIAHEQSGYQLRLSNGFDSNVVYGAARSYKLPCFLPDGIVSAFLSVTNANGMWSVESEQKYTIRNIPGKQIAISCACRANGVHASFSTDGNYTSLYLLRDGTPIARLPGAKEGTFFDALSLGQHKYKIRGDQGNGYYTDSPEQIAVVRVPCGMLSAVDKIDWIPMRLRAGEPPSHDADITADVSFVHYQGRTSPVSYSMGFLTKTHTLSYTFRTREEYQKLEALVGKTVVYKDVLGDSFIGTFTSVTPGYSRRVDFTITITETDYTQEVAYE